MARSVANAGEVHTTDAPGPVADGPERTSAQNLTSMPGPDAVRPAPPELAARPGPPAPAQVRSTPTRSPGNLFADRPPAKATSTQADRASPSQRPPDVADLMFAGRQVRDRLAADGVALSRSVLIKGLRAQNIPVSTDRATALLAALRRDTRTAVTGIGHG